MFLPSAPAGCFNGGMLAPGDLVDDFEAVDNQGQTVTLSQMLQSGSVVLYFYIKAKTPG